MVLNQNGIFSRAEKSAVITEIAKAEETAKMIYSEKIMDNAENDKGSQVETSEVITKLQELGYHIEKRPVAEGDITGISLDKTSVTMGKNKTEEIKVTYEGAEDPFVYYLEVQDNYYQMHSKKGDITIDKTESGLTSSDFEVIGGESAISSALSITTNLTNIITAVLKEGSNNTIEISSSETEGDTTVTVKYGKLAPKICTVKVIEPILATGITLNETEYVVTGGESWTNDLPLKATLEPANVTEKEVTWKSSNPEIATVDNNGLVKAGTKGGDVTITATTKDGTNLSAECKIITELFGKINSDKTAYTDSDGNTVQIPDGFAVGTSDNVNKVICGLVAQDNEGNQFVWIPVGEVKKNNITDFTVTLGRYKFVKDKAIPESPVQTQNNYTEAVNIRPSGYISDFQESINQTGKGAPAKDLKEFIDNTIVDKGYWLGRYEASNDTGTKVKYDKKVCSGIEQTQASSDAQGLKLSGTYKSDLVNSYAWDTAIVFIEKSGNTGYASQESINSSALNTGKSGDKVCNVYDMASNYFEWSTEACTNQNYPRAYRGGCFDYHPNGFTALRNRVTSYPTWVTSFRCILYRF